MVQGQRSAAGSSWIGPGMIEKKWYVLLTRNGMETTVEAKATPIYLEFFEEFIGSILEKPVPFKMTWNISNHQFGSMWFGEIDRTMADPACCLVESPHIGRKHGMIASPVVFTGLKQADGSVELLDRETAYQLADQLKRNSPICVEGDLILSTYTLLSKVEK